MPKNLQKSTNKLRDKRKELVLDLMKKSLGNITYTCEKAEIDRTTYYMWINKDEKFREAIENIDFDEMKVDIAELGMIGLAKEKNYHACKFILENKGTRRGYTKKLDNQINIQNNSITVDNLLNVLKAEQKKKQEQLEQIEFDGDEFNE